MTYAPQTAETLKSLTWNEIRALHGSLKLKATKTTATRADYEQRILAAQPQKVEEAIAPAATTVTKCSECPFARHIDGGRYCCQIAATAQDTVRGHWEPRTDCIEALQSIESPQEIPASEEIEPEMASPDPVGAPALTREELIDRAREVREMLEGMLQEAASSAPAPYIPHSPQLAWDGKCKCQQCHTRHTSVQQPIKLNKRPPIIRAYPHSAPEVKSIRWLSPFKGEVLGKSGYRPFFIFDNEICIILQSNSSVFIAREFKKQNYLHKIVRQAIEVGASFNPATHFSVARAKGFGKANIEEVWENSRNIGCIYQAADGWWWAWSECQNPAQKFASKAEAVGGLKP